MARANVGDTPRDTEHKMHTSTLKPAIIDLMTDFSIELTPRELKAISTTANHLPLRTRIYITSLAGADPADTVRAAQTLRDQGMTPVPHLAARAMRDEAHLEAILRALREQAEVKNILVIGGSIKRPVGSFDRTTQLLETGLFAKYEIASIGVAGHPEGSPDIPEEELHEAVRQKNALAERASNRFHITTQFCFEAKPITDWEHTIRQAGNRLDIHVGLAGLASLSTLIKHAKNCGVGPSLGVLTRRAGALFKLSAATTPFKIVCALAQAKLRDDASRIKRCHFFPFGSFAATAAWATALSTGDFVISDEGTEIIVRTPDADDWR
jgi:methylenetetrahydrofolate reductase (NADPH)